MNEIRAVVLQEAAGAVRVAIAVPGGYSSGFPFPAMTAQFTLGRLLDGTAVLQVPNPIDGLPPLEERISPLDLPGARRAGVRALEFGTYDVPASASVLWSTLGLPRFMMPVLIDIKPGEDPNSVSLWDRGLLPVAILGSATFDVSTINPETLELGGVDIALRGSAKAPKFAYSYDDVNGDGYPDLVAFFDVPVLVEAGALTESTLLLNLTGALVNGRPIQGADSVRVVP